MVVRRILRQFAYRYDSSRIWTHPCYKKVGVQLLNRNVEHTVHERSPQVHTSTHPVRTQYAPNTIDSYKSTLVLLVRAGLLKVWSRMF